MADPVSSSFLWKGAGERCSNEDSAKVPMASFLSLRIGRDQQEQRLKSIASWRRSTQRLSSKVFCTNCASFLKTALPQEPPPGPGFKLDN
jgi:hypothetical protein